MAANPLPHTPSVLLPPSAQSGDKTPALLSHLCTEMLMAVSGCAVKLSDHPGFSCTSPARLHMDVQTPQGFGMRLKSIQPRLLNGFVGTEQHL